MTIAVDYDGTIIDDGAYPNAGNIKPYAAQVLRWLKDQGYTLVLWTCREGHALLNALKLLDENHLYFDAINENVNSYYKSRKIVANIYIDDLAWPHTPIDWKNIGISFGMIEGDFKDE